MRRTIHLVQRGLPSPLRCLACGEVSPVRREDEVISRRGLPAICMSRSDWDTIYRDHEEYRRCVDPPDARDRTARMRCPTPTKPGFYWAEWRIAEDGTWPPDSNGVPRDHVVSTNPEVVEVVVDIGSDDPPNTAGFGYPLIVLVCGFEAHQQLDNFVWRSGRLVPDHPTDRKD